MTNAPRTKKQLREALEHAQVRLKFLDETLQEKQADLYTQAATLKALGAKPTKRTIGGFHSSRSFTTWDVSEIAASQRQLEKAVEPAATQARRETLEKVIDGLKLGEYDYREPGAYYYGFRTDGDQRPGHERLWADIQTALKVRAERKEDAEREATEKKVAGLTKPKAFENTFSFTFVPATDADRPEKAPKGGTRPVDKPEPKKKPAAKAAKKSGDKK